jgi:hypothetical protein
MCWPDEEGAVWQSSNNWPNAKWRHGNQGWMTSNSNHGCLATDKDGSQMAARQTTNAPDEWKMVVGWSRMNQQMRQTNEDIAMCQPTMVQAKCRCDGMAIKKCTSQMRNGGTAINEDAGKIKPRQLGGSWLYASQIK